MALSFAFGGNTGETPESIARKRKIANALLASNTMPQNVGQGIAAIGDALAGRFMTSKLDAQDKAGQAEVGSILEAPAFPSSVAAGGSPTAPAALGEDASAIKAGLVERGIPEHVADGFIMNFKDESGLNPGINEKNPTVAGSRGGYGLYQLTGPRRDAYEAFAANRGVAPSDTNAQLDFLVSELKGPEANAAKSIFAAPDAGSAAAAIAKNFLRPNAKSLAERVAKYTSGGAPVQTASLDPSAGMAADFGDHGPVTELPPEVRAQRLAANQAGMANFTDAGAPRVSPDIMAALQPPTQQGSVIQVPPREDVAGPAPVGVGGVPAGSGGTPVMDFSSNPQFSASAGIPFEQPQGMPTPSPVSAALAQPQTAPQPQSSVSDALLRKNDMALGGIMAPAGTPQPANAKLGGVFPDAPSPDRAPIPAGVGGFFPPAPSAAPSGGGQDEAARMLKVINHPYATEAQKQYALSRLKEIQAQSDPNNQADLEYKRAQIDALRNKPVEKPTSDIQEYEYAKKNDGFQGSFVDFQLAQKKAAASQVNVGGTTIEGEKKYDQTVGEGYAKDFTTMQTEAGGARKAITSLGAMEKEMDNPNFYSGAGGTARANLKRLAASMGLDPEAASSMEAFGALSKKAVLDAMGGSLGTGVSNADRDYIEGQVPTIDTSPAGNKKIIGIQRKINQRKIEVAQRARDYARKNNGRIDAGFYDELDQWSEEHPLFDKEEALPVANDDPAPEGVDPSMWKYATPEERKLFKK